MDLATHENYLTTNIFQITVIQCSCLVFILWYFTCSHIKECSSCDFRVLFCYKQTTCLFGMPLYQIPKCKRSRPRHIAFKLRSRFITTSSCIRCCRKCSLFAGVMVLVMHQPLLLRIYALDGLSSNLSISSSLVASLSYMHGISLLHKGGGSQIK